MPYVPEETRSNVPILPLKRVSSHQTRLNAFSGCEKPTKGEAGRKIVKSDH